MFVEEVRNFLASLLFLAVFFVELFLVDKLYVKMFVIEAFEEGCLLLNKGFKLVLVGDDCLVVEGVGDDIGIINGDLLKQVLVGEDLMEVVDFDEGVEEDVLVVVINVSQ